MRMHFLWLYHNGCPRCREMTCKCRRYTHVPPSHPAVRSWRVSHRIGPAAVHHHGWEADGQQRPGVLCSVSCLLGERPRDEVDWSKECQELSGTSPAEGDSQTEASCFFPCSKLKAWHQKRKLAKVRGGQICQEPKRWEEDYELIECEGLFEEYLEMGEQEGRSPAPLGHRGAKGVWGLDSGHHLVQ